MVRSSKCNLEGLAPAELVRKNEEEYELGGYFVINGVEKVWIVSAILTQNYAILLTLSLLAIALQGRPYGDCK